VIKLLRPILIGELVRLNERLPVADEQLGSRENAASLVPGDDHEGDEAH